LTFLILNKKENLNSKARKEILILMLKTVDHLNFTYLNQFKFVGLKQKKSQESLDIAIGFITSFKGSVQLCANGFPFTRHRVVGSTVYWRCVQFKSLG
jgi:hypothetical protein